ncbi:hypothetical protein B4092_4714 [Bacillus licheniformis]|nr:hypothetical protein B4092_4714 [Bacillus licheniformis]
MSVVIPSSSIRMYCTTFGVSKHYNPLFLSVYKKSRLFKGDYSI